MGGHGHCLWVCAAQCAVAGTFVCSLTHLVALFVPATEAEEAPVEEPAKPAARARRGRKQQQEEPAPAAEPPAGGLVGWSSGRVHLLCMHMCMHTLCR